ncbi:MAG TPA: hypothetical protein VF785_23655 [Gemmatimonadaceae bacterium]
MTMRVLVWTLSAVVVGCGTFRPSQRPDASAERLGPRSALLNPPAFGDEAQRLRVTIQGAADSVERPMSEKTWSLKSVAGAPNRVLVTSSWPAPYSSIDSLVVERNGLVPVREWLSYRGVTRDYQFLGNRVRGTVQHVDSAARTIDLTFPEDVFAFSEVELLVRSLPLRPAFTTVVPLFSENDEAVEHDTMTVVARDRSPEREPGWIVRFADPAIVTRYVIGERSRAILAAETTQRRSGARLRYVDAPK